MNIALKRNRIGSSPKSEILPLTGLRAVAAIAVVIHHIGLPSSAPDGLHMVAQCGFIGVPLFFMLSGFVLAFNYPDLHFKQGKKVTRFYIARIARVMPLYWAVLTWLVVVRAARGLPQDSSLPRQYLGLQVWSPNLSVSSGMYNAPAWSVCVELFLYATFPFLVVLIAALARRYGARGLLVAMAAAFAVQLVMWAYFALSGRADLPAVDPDSAHRWLYRTPLTRLPEFIVGMSLAFLHLRGFRFPRPVAHVTQAAVVAFVFFACYFRDGTNGSLGAAFFGTMWTIPFGLLILSLASGHGFFGRFLSTRSMVVLGTASYALYMTHRPLLPRFGADLVHRADGYWGYIMVLVVLGLALIFAEGAHRYVELPCRRAMLHRADKWLFNRNTNTTPAPEGESGAPASEPREKAPLGT